MTKAKKRKTMAVWSNQQRFGAGSICRREEEQFGNGNVKKERLLTHFKARGHRRKKKNDHNLKSYRKN